MKMSVKDIYAVVAAAKAMAENLQKSAESAMETAKAVQVIANDCAEQLKVMKESGASEDPVAEAAVSAVQEKRISLAELRAFVAERSDPQTRPKIKEILTRFGAAKLTELPEEQYAAVMNEVAKL